jgi:hypothetical protein
MIYKEWIWTIRNWTRIGFPVALFLLFMVPGLASGRAIPPSMGTFPLIFILMFTSIFNYRLQEEIQMQLGAIYLRTRVHPLVQMVTKWGFDAAVSAAVLVVGAYILFGRTQGITLLDLVILGSAAGTMTATNMAITGFFARFGNFIRPLIFILFFAARGEDLPFTWLIPPLTAIEAVTDAAAGTASVLTPALLAIQIAILLAAVAFVYKKVLLRNL